MHFTKNLVPLLAGPVLFAGIQLLAGWLGWPEAISDVLAVAAWMILWWMTEAVPIPVTALIPMVLFPFLGVMETRAATQSYANPIIFLFMGGFIIALAMEKHNLHKRIALNLVRLTGTHANGIILGFMLATALLSMWISNTATTVMMLPIGTSVLRLLEQQTPPEKAYDLRRFSLVLMLGIAYAANIGGTGTLIGTPPNVVLAGILQTQQDVTLYFSRWLLIGIPLVVILLSITYLLLTRVLYTNKLGKVAAGETVIHDELEKLGKISKEEKMVAVVFFLTAMTWITRKPVNDLLGVELLDDTMIAMGGGILMFILPVNLRQRYFLLDWESMSRLPWGILLLFGGGLCLAGALEKVGIIEMIGDMVAAYGTFPLWVMLGILIGIMLFMTELMSNVALTAIFIPVVLGIAEGTGIDPLEATIPVTLASSCAFMMPISTPPNAIVFASGHIKIPQMMRAGILLNIISILILLLWGVFLVPWVY